MLCITVFGKGMTAHATIILKVKKNLSLPVHGKLIDNVMCRFTIEHVLDYLINCKGDDCISAEDWESFIARGLSV